MAEYIDKKGIYEKACRGCIYHGDEIGSCFFVEPCERLVAAFAGADPAPDVVAVVRCGQCKHVRPEVDAYTQEVVGHWCGLLDLGSIEEKHFCSYGERRETP